jgi:hypothetical protein
MKRIASLLILTLLLPTIALAGLGSKKAAYMGGSMPEMGGAKKAIEGELDTTNNDELRFVYKDKESKTLKTASIPYAQILDIEYGQKAGRRVGMAIGTTILLGPLGLLSLFSKKRKHYLTIGYSDKDGKAQAAVFELGKDIVRTTLAIVEKRSGKELQYQDENARKANKGN